MGRSDAGDRGDDAAEHMIHAVVLAGILDAHHVADALDHADGAVVTGAVRTERARFLVGNHAAFLAVADIVPEAVDGFREMMHVLLGLAKQVQGQPERAAPADARQRADGFDRIGKEFGGVFFFIRHDNRQVLPSGKG